VRRWIRRLTLVAVATLALAAGHPSANAACPALDVACLADEVVTAGEGLIEDTTDPIDTPLDDTIDPIVDDVLDRVHDVLGGGGPVDVPDLPDPVGGGGGGSHGGGLPGGDEPQGTPTPTDHGDRGVVGGRSPDGPGIAGPAGPIISAASGTSPPERVDRTSGNSFSDAVGGVARSLAIVLALFGLAVAFVAIQDRLDRNDPRLALAPVESDEVGFA